MSWNLCSCWNCVSANGFSLGFSLRCILFSNMWIQMEISVWEDYLYPTQHLVFNVFNTPSFHSLKFAILSKVVIIYVGLQHDGRLVREALQGRFMKLQGLPYLLVFFSTKEHHL